MDGQVLDDVKSKAQLLLAIQERKQAVEAVWVKLIQGETDHIQDYLEIQSFDATFKIYGSTRFNELKSAACRFWNKIDQTYEMTDEYFNNLMTYQGTICDFYRGAYVPLNKDRHAIVYLFESNRQQLELNPL